MKNISFILYCPFAMASAPQGGVGAVAPLMTLAWGVDEECIKVTRERFQYIQHIECFLKEDYQAVTVASMIQERDLGHQCLIIVTAGTPCPDYSVVAAKSEGRNKPEGANLASSSIVSWT